MPIDIARAFMQAIKRVRKLLETQPELKAAQTLSSLVLALESGDAFDLAKLYALDYDHFDLAIELLSEWRLDRYYSAKFRLLDVSMHATHRFESNAR